jgi:hypothetical protein
MARQLGCQASLLASISHGGEAIVSIGSVDGFERVRVVSFDKRSGASRSERSNPSAEAKETAPEPSSQRPAFGGQVSFGRDGKWKGTASLKNWKKDSG